MIYTNFNGPNHTAQEHRRARRPDPASSLLPKYKPTSTWDSCETDGCRYRARVACATCGAETCLEHADHDHLATNVHD